MRDIIGIMEDNALSKGYHAMEPSTAALTPGNVHDSVAFDDVYDKVTEKFPEVETIVADSAY